MISRPGIRIHVSGDEYSEVLQAPRLSDAAEVLKDFGELYLVYDEAVASFAADLAGVVKFRSTVALEVSEEAKSMETVLRICSTLMSAEASREAVLVALGGGTVSDIAGFAAAIYKRGIRTVNIPTTLLAQVDAAIGGKSGVNFQGYKNILGAIRQPLYTILSPEPLTTLPRRQYLAGVAELIKTIIVNNEPAVTVQNLRFAHPTIRNAHDPCPFTWPRAAMGFAQSQPVLPESLIVAAAKVKAGIVERDPFEAGERRVLNLGHTFAHAIEHEAAVRGDDILQGEAVAMGIVLAGRLSDRLGESSGMEEMLSKMLREAGLEVECPYTTHNLVDAMRQDKKAVGESVSFVLPKAIGDVIVKPVLLDDVRRLLSSD